MAPQTPTTGSLNDFVDMIKKNAAQTGAGLEQIARGGMLGLSDTGTSLVRGVGALAGSEGLQDWASETAANAREYYDPQGGGGRAGAIIGRLLGEGALSLGAGGLIGKGVMKAAPKAAALLEGGNIARQAAVNTLLSAPVDAALSVARAKESGQSVPKTVAQDAALNFAGGTLLGGVAKGIANIAPYNPRALFNAVEDLVNPTPPINLARTAMFNATPETGMERNINEIAQQLLAKGFRPEQAETGLARYARQAAMRNDNVTDMNTQVANRMRELQSPNAFRGDTLAASVAKSIVKNMQDEAKRPIAKVTETPFEYGPGKSVQYTIGGKPIDLEITPAAGGRITVDVDDLPKDQQGKTFTTTELRNLFKQIMIDEDATGIASFRRGTGNVMVVDRPGVKPEIPAMTNKDKQTFFKEMGLEDAPANTKQVYLSEYMSGVYINGEDPATMKNFLKDMLKENPVPPSNAMRPRADTLTVGALQGLPLIDTSDEAMAAGVEAARRAQMPRELPPIPAVGPSTPKIRDFDKLPRLDEEGAAQQAAREIELQLLRQYLETPKSKSLLAARVDPEGVAKYIAALNRISKNRALQSQGDVRFTESIIADETGQPLYGGLIGPQRAQEDLAVASAEAAAAARNMENIPDPYNPQKTITIPARALNKITPEFMANMERLSRGMDAVSGYGRPIAWQVSPNTLRQTVPQIRREAAQFAENMELPSTFSSFQQIQNPTDVGELGNMTPAQVRKYLADLTKELGGTMGKTKPRKKGK